MNAKPLFAAALLAAGAAVAQSPPAKPAQDCFYHRDTDSFRPVDRLTLNLRTGNRYYQLKFLNPCIDLDFSQTIGMTSASGSNFICAGTGNNVRILTRTSAGRSRCVVQSVIRLTADEVAAMPKNQIP